MALVCNSMEDKILEETKQEWDELAETDKEEWVSLK